MSRWTDNFQTHAFRPQWTKLKELLSVAKVDDATIVTSLTELSRLKKAVAYIDGLIESIDPELIPIAAWDSFQEQTTQCCAQVAAYNSNRSIGHIAQANAHADNLLTYVRPYMLAPGKAGRALQKAARAYAETIEELTKDLQAEAASAVAELGELRDKGVTDGQTVAEARQEIEAARDVALGDKDGKVEGVVGKLNEVLAVAVQRQTEIVGYYERLLGDDDEEPSIKSEIADAAEAITEQSAVVEAMSAKASTIISALTAFNQKIFGIAEADGSLKGGLAEELRVQQERLAQFEKEQGVRYRALNDQIETLLPGATSAGLATSYKSIKESFNTPIRNASRMFYLSIAVLISASLLMTVKNASFWSIEFISLGDWNAVIRSIVNKLPFYGPALWLAYYATKRRSEFQRLQQEYAHKEALASSYYSFKKQIEELGETEQELLRALMQRAIESLAHNASITLDGSHGEKMPLVELVQTATDQILKSESFLSNVKRKLGID